MPSKPFRTFSFIAAAVAVWAFALPAQAVYDVGWDPAFAGNVLIDWIPGPGCVIAPSTDVHCNSIKVLGVDFDDSLFGEWTSSPLQTGLSGDLLFNSLGVLVGTDLTVGNLVFTGPSNDDTFLLTSLHNRNDVWSDDGNPCLDDGAPTLNISDGDGNRVTFNCPGDPTRGGTSTVVTITSVPEPATLGLLGLGLGALALGRRRRIG